MAIAIAHSMAIAIPVLPVFNIGHMDIAIWHTCWYGVVGAHTMREALVHQRRKLGWELVQQLVV